jgi:hypothetical protein
MSGLRRVEAVAHFGAFHLILEHLLLPVQQLGRPTGPTLTGWDDQIAVAIHGLDQLEDLCRTAERRNMAMSVRVPDFREASEQCRYHSNELGFRAG